MSDPSRAVQRLYLALTLSTTLAASSIWGVNTLFLLDAGLSNTEAFLANAFFTLGMVIFEIPTGVLADTRGRRFSYLLGTGTLLLSTLLYLWMWQLRGPLWGWAVASVLIGLGFTFLSGATEAWLVDALESTGYRGRLEVVFGRGQVVAGIAMLTGSVLGGVVAQFTSLGVPYLMRAGLLAVSLLIAWRFMRDLGFRPEPHTRPGAAVRSVLAGAVAGGLGNRPVRWLMIAAPFTVGTEFYIFYALQPFLLDLYGRPDAYSIAGLAAALVAGAQIAGGLLAPRVLRLFRRRTDALILQAALSVALLALLGSSTSLVMALVVVAAWSMGGAIAGPLRQSFLNGLIPSSQRATVLSFDSLMGSSGGVVIQPGLGRVADLAGYPASFAVAAAVQALAIPFRVLARQEKAPSDLIRGDDGSQDERPAPPAD